MSDGVTVADASAPDLPLIYVNDAFVRLTGYSRDDVIGKNCRFLQGPETDPSIVAEIGRSLNRRAGGQFLLRNYRQDGTPFWNELKITAARGADGVVSHFIGIQNDVTDRVRAEEAQRRISRLQNERSRDAAELKTLRTVADRLEPMETILGIVRFGVILTTESGEVTFLNQTAAELLAVHSDEALGQPLTGLFEQGGELREVFPLTGAERERRIESRLRLHTGRELAIGLTLQRAPAAPGQPPYQLITFRELGELRQLEDEMRELKRLSSLGRMAAGFAHQVRGPLSAIRSLAEALVVEMPDDDPRREYGSRTVALVERVEELVRRSLRFTHSEGSSVRPVEPERMVEEAVALLDPRWSDAGARPAVEVGDPMPQVMVDPAQIVEVLIVLLENAVDAVREPSRVGVTTRLMAKPAASHRGQCVAIDVVDHGPGIPAERLDRIFDPFFSTKARGAGLGLPIALRIAHENGAKIQVTSTVGQGSTFSLLLPVARVRAA